MSFEKSEGLTNIFDSDHERENKIWRKLSTLILGSKQGLRKFLCSVNHDKYAEITQEAKKEPSTVKISKSRPSHPKSSNSGSISFL